MQCIAGLLHSAAVWPGLPQFPWVNDCLLPCCADQGKPCAWCTVKSEQAFAVFQAQHQSLFIVSKSGLHGSCNISPALETSGMNCISRARNTAKVLAGAGNCFWIIPAFQLFLASPTVQPQIHLLIVFCTGAEEWFIGSRYDEGANATGLYFAVFAKVVSTKTIPDSARKKDHCPRLDCKGHRLPHCSTRGESFQMKTQQSQWTS